MAKQRIIPIIYKVDYSQVDKSTESVKKAERATENLNKEIKDVGGGAGKAFTTLKNAIVATGIIGIIGTVGKRIFDLGVNAEQTAIAFNTLTGSVDKGKKLLAELTKFSIVTPFTPDQVNKAAKALLSFGVEANKIIPTLKILGDVSSGTGKDLTEMAVIFGQIRSTGRLMGQDLLQLINAGFNPLQIISQKTGKSVGDLKAEMEKGLITFDMVEQSFIDATSAGGLFFNLMEKQSQSVGGKLSTFTGNLEEVGKAIFNLNSGPINDLVDKLIKISETLMLFFESTEDRQNKFLQSEINVFSKFAEGYEDLDQALKDYTKTVELNRAAVFRQQQQQLDVLNDEDSNPIQRAAAESLNEILQDKVEVYNILIPELEKYIERTKEATKADQEAASVAASLNAAKLKRATQFKPSAPTGELPKEETTMELPEEFVDELNEKAMAFLGFNDFMNSEADKQRARELRESLAHKEELEEIEKQHLQNIADARQASFELAIDLGAMLLESAINRQEEETSLIRGFYDDQIALAGDNERKKEELEIERDRRLKAAERVNKENQKRNARNSIGIDTAIAIIKTFAQFGYPAGIVPAALMAGIGVFQASQVGKYAKGVIDLQGPGTTTSDSIPAMLSRGESVMTAEETLNSRGILKAIRAKKFDDKVLEKLYKSSKIGGDGTAFSDAGIIAAVRGLKPDDVIKKGSYLYDVKTSNGGNVEFIRRKYIH